MREPKKVLTLLRGVYPNDIEVYQSMNKTDRKIYGSYIIRKKTNFLSPTAWLQKKNSVLMSFQEIADRLGISRQAVVDLYITAILKIKSKIKEEE